jgi:hypothetical protein
MRPMRLLVCVVVVGCGSSPPPSPAPVAVVAADAAPPVSIDAGPPAELVAAPAWVFRYNAPGRLETWTLRTHGGDGMVVVESTRGTTRYVGTATDGASLQLALAAGAQKLSLDCKHEQLPVGAKCGDPKAKKVDVLNCFHPDFKSPMTFGAAPGIEYVIDDKCNGYRLLP